MTPECPVHEECTEHKDTQRRLAVVESNHAKVADIDTCVRLVKKDVTYIREKIGAIEETLDAKADIRQIENYEKRLERTERFLNRLVASSILLFLSLTLTVVVGLYK